MDKQLELITEESIQLELLVSELYLLFHELFPDDGKFWWRLVEEERNHAALIRSAREYFAPVDQFPEKLVSDNFAALREANKHLQELLATFREAPPQRAEAFNCALKLESTAGELHFQHFLEASGLSRVEQIFKQLNGNDREHARRIQLYMSENDIPFVKSEENV